MYLLVITEHLTLDSAAGDLQDFGAVPFVPRLDQSLAEEMACGGRVSPGDSYLDTLAETSEKMEVAAVGQEITEMDLEEGPLGQGFVEHLNILVTAEDQANQLTSEIERHKSENIIHVYYFNTI